MNASRRRLVLRPMHKKARLSKDRRALMPFTGFSCREKPENTKYCRMKKSRNPTQDYGI